MKSTAVAGANIALIKYWGRRDHDLNVPLTGSVSLTLDGLLTRTTVEFREDLSRDELQLNGARQSGRPLERVARVMDRIRDRVKSRLHARIVSENSFAAAAGMASSASAFAALPAAAFHALGVNVEPRELSTFARLGSGSACRSVFGGLVEWHAGTDHESSYAEPMFPSDHLDLHDVVLVFSGAEKKVKSSEGHSLADTSPFNEARIRAVNDMLPRIRDALAAKDLHAMGEMVEKDALLMHGVMMTSSPSLVYWTPETVAGIHAVRAWRESGIPCWFTIDAGPNLHVLTPADHAQRVADLAVERLALPRDRVMDCGPGEGVRVIEDHLF